MARQAVHVVFDIAVQRHVPVDLQALVGVTVEAAFGHRRMAPRGRVASGAAAIDLGMRTDAA